MFVCPIHFAPGWIDKESTLLEPRGGEESGKEKKMKQTKPTMKTFNNKRQEPMIKSGVSFLWFVARVLHVFKLIDTPFGVAFADLP
jgi:hypothetical protein